MHKQNRMYTAALTMLLIYEHTSSDSFQATSPKGETVALIFQDKPSLSIDLPVSGCLHR